MGRIKEKMVGAGVAMVGVVILAIPIIVYRQWDALLGLVTAVFIAFPGILALRAGLKLIRYPARREITLDKVRKNAERHEFWERIGLT